MQRARRAWQFDKNGQKRRSWILSVLTCIPVRRYHRFVHSVEYFADGDLPGLGVLSSISSLIGASFMFIYGAAAAAGINEPINQQQMKSLHLRQIFDLVLEEGSVSRGWLAKNMNLSPTAVSSLVDELLENDVLVTIGQGTSRGAGRKPIMLEINRDWRRIATFYICPDRIEYALFDMTSRMINNDSEPVSHGRYREAVYAIRERSVPTNDIIAVCIAVPATIDSDNQRLIMAGVDIRDDQAFFEEISAMYPSSVLLVGNDSAAYAYAEKEYGSVDKADNLIYLNYNRSIGAGIIVDGTVFNDNMYTSGEISHMSIDMNGPQCICGNRGCLERMISVPAVLRNVRHHIESGGYSILTEMTEGDTRRIDMDLLVKAFESGDMLATAVFEDLALKLSFAIRNLMSLFHPKEIVIGGIAQSFGESFLNMVQNNTQCTFYWDRFYETKIRFTRVEQFGANIGLAKYYLDQMLSLEEANALAQGSSADA